MKKVIKKYLEQSYEFLTSWEYEEILNYICENLKDAPVLYRGINIDINKIDVGDTIDLNDKESFLSMSPNIKYAWNFGDIILKVEGIEGCPINEEEWLVINKGVNVEKIEYDHMKDIYIISCR